MLSKEDQIMMETMYWCGIPTLFRCKNDPDPKNCDIACLIPTKDQKNNITSMVAASIMFEIISLISVNLKK